MMLSDENGRSVSLGSRLGSGGEAEVFEVGGRADVVAKIYRRSSAERTAKLRAMLSAPPSDPTRAQGHQSICWPTSLLFDSGRINIGFLMPRIDSARSLPLFKLYNPNDRQEVAPGFTWQYLVRTAANIASVVSAIHAKGYVVGDLNESNLLVSDSALVALVDCDSMQVPKPGGATVFRCPVGKPEFTAPELQGCNFSRVDRVKPHDNFALGVLIFELLMEGTHPFSGVWRMGGDPPTIEERIRRGISPYVGASAVMPMPGAPSIDILPSSLQGLVLRCFRDGQQSPGARPSPREWQNALTAFEAALSTCSRNQRHIYGAHLASCPWCERTNLLGGLDPFPAHAQQRPLRSAQFAARPPIGGGNPVAPVAPAYIPGPQPLPARAQPAWGRYALVALIVVVAFAILKAVNQPDSRTVSSNANVTQNEAVSVVTASRSGVVKAALSCTSSRNCPSVQRLFEEDSVFRRGLLDGIARAGIVAPKWISKGVVGNALPVVFQNRNLLWGSICQPHNCMHQFSFVHEPQTGRTFGGYLPDDASAKVIWFGEPTPAEQGLLNRYAFFFSASVALLHNPTILPVTLR